ncbi:hypothetical protein [Brumimicrobium oceani]|uniref:Lipoprotein n=1 Tax=Brumimicrobium oceani TaxID=2100725 RepID=A0A2U2X0A7_9FLAO|nr:hypothetical protein [Brumimicrobium oceani]PWH81225.1 hypothetical protein DIT68_15940 [Brumimicrobium oceani]
MKKVILKLMIVVLVLVFNSCQKQEIVKNEMLSKTISINENNEKVSIIVGMRIRWDEWGRANHDCGKAGLCNIRVDTIEITIGKSAPIIVGEDGGMYIEVLVDSDLIFEDSSTDFYIDEDLFAEQGDNLYKIESGVFEIDYSLGSLGGYKIPVIKQ